MFDELDERDTDLDIEDADLENENSDDEEAEDEDTADDEDDEAGDSDDDKDSDEDLDKPLTKRDLNKILESKQNKNNAMRRVDSKKGRDNKQPSKELTQRLSKIEQSQQKADLLERKRTFGYENNLSPKEVDHVFRLTKRPTAKFLKDPVVSAALGAIRAQSNVRDNTPSGKGQSFKSSGVKPGLI